MWLSSGDEQTGKAEKPELRVGMLNLIDKPDEELLLHISYLCIFNS